MRKKLIFLLPLFFVVSLPYLRAADQPDILFLLADDMSHEALGAAQLLDIDTPNLDRLAESGTRFTNAYNMGSYSPAVCIASRSMLNSGRFVWNAKSRNLRKCAKEGLFWSQRLKNVGYRTYMAGKWHLFGVVPEAVFDVVQNVRPGMPADGYDHSKFTINTVLPDGYNRPLDKADYESGWKPWDREQGGFWEGGTHWSEVLANDGIEFIQQASIEDAPFFMYLSFNAPHDPRQSPKEFVERYPLDRVELPENFLPEYPFAEPTSGKNLRDELLMPYPRTEYSVKVNRQEYLAIVTHMDEQIGRILDALEASGRSENTWIFFTADHGLGMGRHGLAGKQNMYEHSMRVPFIVSGPGVSAGAVLDTPIYFQDVVPTTLELAKADASTEMDFKSLMPILNGGDGQEHYPAIYGAYLDRQRMIRIGDWKLIHYPGIGVERFFNIKEDPLEMCDLARPDLSHPKVPTRKQQAMQEKLRRSLVALGRDMDDPLLTAVEDGE